MPAASKPKLLTQGIIARWRIRRAAKGPLPQGFTNQPEPRSIGSFARGRQLLAGNVQFTGHLVELKGRSLWDIPLPSQEFSDDLQSFLWLDDLAAVGTPQARSMAQCWVLDWITAFESGRGSGWATDVVARRLVRWIHHGIFLMANSPREESDRYFRALAQHTRLIAGTLKRPAGGLAGFEAAVGTLYAALTVEGLGRYASPAQNALSFLCLHEVDGNGGIVSRNPEELLEIFTLLNWAMIALDHASQPVPADISDALRRIAPTLRVLRHANGHLTRFHGGGRGAEGRLDEALALSGIRAKAPKERAMGYLRVTSGSTTLIADADAPPAGPASKAAHASTGAFELTNGKLPLIVSCGSGASFGEAWRLAARATPAHSTLGIDGVSSSRFAPGARGASGLFAAIPQDVKAKRISAIDGTRLVISHDGYRPTHGLIHKRILDLTIDGLGLAGDDLLFLRGAEAGDLLAKQIDKANGKLMASLRFHLHPDVNPSLDLNGKAISLKLSNGTIWVFRHESAAQLTLEPSVYLEQGRVMPRTSEQIVLTQPLTDAQTRMRWSLAKVVGKKKRRTDD